MSADVDAALARVRAEFAEGLRSANRTRQAIVALEAHRAAVAAESTPIYDGLVAELGHRSWPRLEPTLLQRATVRCVNEHRVRAAPCLRCVSAEREAMASA